MPTVVIDAGHGGFDLGATNGSRQEKNDNLRFALALGNVLTNCGLRVIQTRTTDVFLPLEERARISNNANADLFVSVHRNSHTNPTAHGFETWIYQNPSEASIAAAYLVQNRLVRAGVSADRGIKYGNFAVLRLTRAPAMLQELGFISNTEDNRLFDSRFNAYVLATANGILSYFGIACPGVNAPGTTPPINPPPVTPNPPPTQHDRLGGTVRTTGGNLNFRSAPNSGAQIIGLIPNGAAVQILGEQNGFYNVVWNNQTGWASASFINPTPRTGRVATSGGNLNLRSGPSSSAPVVASIPNGASVQVRDIVDNFYAVTFNGQQGFASRDFIRLV